MTFHPDDFDPTPEHVQKLFDVLKEGVTAIVDEGDCDGIAPMLGVLCFDPFTGEEQTRMNLLATGFNSGLEKKNAMKVVAASTFAAQKLPLAVGLVAEAWTTRMKSKEAMDDYYKKYLMIADDPDRQEVAVVSALGFPVKDSKAAMGLGMADHRLIKRGAKEIVSWDGDWLLTNDDKSEYQCNILIGFYEAYINFGLKREDYKAYTALAQEMAL